jgi:spermidine/putrescine-binding protein
LPEEGTLLWGDNFVIPANSPHKATAELFLNFLLRPEISAQIIDENFYALPNEAAYPLIKPEVLNDPAIFPPAKALEKGEIILALSPAGQALYNKVWNQFLQAKP